MKKSSFVSLATLFGQYQPENRAKYVSREFQDYGYRLACDLDDLDHKSLYMKLAKNQDRALLDQARRFVIDATQAKSKAKLFMWKLNQLKKAKNSSATGSINDKL